MSVFKDRRTMVFLEVYDAVRELQDLGLTPSEEDLASFSVEGLADDLTAALFEPSRGVRRVEFVRVAAMAIAAVMIMDGLPSLPSLPNSAR